MQQSEREQLKQKIAVISQTLILHIIHLVTAEGFKITIKQKAQKLVQDSGS